MRVRGFLFGVGGGILGTVLVAVALLATGALNVKTNTVVENVSSQTPATYSPVATTGGLTPAQIYQMDAKSVVEIVSVFPGQQSFFGSTPSQKGIGSGFVVDSKGYILTNAHVVVEYQDTSQNPFGGSTSTVGTPASSVTVVFKGTGKATVSVPAKVVGVDSSNDVALIQVDASKAPNVTPIALGDSSRIAVGEAVVAIGNPLGYDFSLSSGVISAVGRTIDAPNGNSTISNALQTDAAINPGNSGGPLINSQGAVVGINDQIASSSGGNEGVGFAVPINTAVQSMKQLQTHGGVTWLGISGMTITSDLAKALNLSQNEGVLVEAVVPNSPAEKAGLRAGTQQVTIQGQPYAVGGDVIKAFNGTQLKSMEQLVTLISQHKPGDKVTLTVQRGGKSVDLQATLELRPAGT